MLALCMRRLNTLCNTTTSDDEEEILLPITNVDDLKELNASCKNLSFAKRLVSMNFKYFYICINLALYLLMKLFYSQGKKLALVHISDEKSALRKLLMELVEDHVFLHVSWKGTPNKLSFVNLFELNAILITTIKKTLKNYTTSMFENSAKAWIRHSHERKNRRNNKENMSN